MSATNKDMLLNGNAAVSKGDYEAFVLLCTDDTVWEFVGEQTLRGKDEVRNWMKESYLVPPQITVDDLIAEGEFLTAVGEVTMKDKEGKPTTYHYCDVWRFRGNKIAGLRAFVVEKKS